MFFLTSLFADEEMFPGFLFGIVWAGSEIRVSV